MTVESRTDPLDLVTMLDRRTVGDPADRELPVFFAGFSAMRCSAFIFPSTLLWLAAFVLTSASADTVRPNVVFILVDDLGWMDLSCQGSDYYRTPHIDRLAKRGTRFTDAYAACPVCSPTRASIMTG